MLKKLIYFGSLAAGLCFAPFAHAQANPTATRLSHVQIGGGYTYARTDYGQRGNKGFTIYGDYDIGVHFGAEAEYHYTSVSTPNHVTENSFLIGPRFILRKHNWRLYGKGMIGIGHFAVPLTPTNTVRADENDFAFAGGGGVEYQITSRLVIRPVDVEYQRWSFRTGLTPLVLTTGAAFHF
jgi:opacity protein-like surface antigen